MKRPKPDWMLYGKRSGPTDHPYEMVYREAADAIIKRAIAHRVGGVELLDANWEVETPGRTDKGAARSRREGSRWTCGCTPAAYRAGAEEHQ